MRVLTAKMFYNKHFQAFFQKYGFNKVEGENIRAYAYVSKLGFIIVETYTFPYINYNFEYIVCSDYIDEIALAILLEEDWEVKIREHFGWAHEDKASKKLL